MCPRRTTILMFIAIAYGNAMLAGCVDHRVNPSFPLTMAQARAAWRQMKANPMALERPVIVLGGIYDPGVAVGYIAGQIRNIATADSAVVSVGFFETGSFDGSARKVISVIEKKFPCLDADRTVEVDVIGFSMGGLVARYAASDAYAARAGKRLNIKRLFTVSSPHRGAKLAWLPTIDQRVIDMRADSDFLERLNGEEHQYQVYAYARLDDEVVGESNAALPGQVAWWLPKTCSLSHMSAYGDTRILADIARRLRGEQPFTAGPAAPLPVD